MRWLVPDLALVVSLLTLVFCLVLFDGTQQLFRDSDSGWHIRTGERILHSGALPRVDPYSLLLQGQPWFAWEWGADVLMGAAHRRGGLAWVAGLYALVLAACTWLWFQLQWRLRGNFLLASAGAVLLLSTTNMHWLARPHLFSWLLLLGTIIYAERSDHPLWIPILGAVLWANLHASFFLGPVVLGFYAAAHVLRPMVWDMDREPEWTRSRSLATAACVMSLGSLANPYGWQLHAHVLKYLLDKELLDRVGEFQSFNFHADGATQILITVGVSAAGAVLALGQRQLAHVFVAALFLAMALRSARALPLLALVVLPLANRAITKALAHASGLRPSLRRWLDAFLTYGHNLRRLDKGLGGLALAPVIVFLVFATLSIPAVASHAGFPAGEFPTQAAEHVPPGARLLAPDKFGGYVIYGSSGTLPVYFDGRSDFYGAAYMKQYLSLIEVRPGWQSILKQAKFTHALLPNRYSLIPALAGLGWNIVYSDDVATLLASPQTERR